MTYLKVVARGRVGVSGGVGGDIWSAGLSFVDASGSAGYVPPTYTGGATLDSIANDALSTWKVLLGITEMRFCQNVTVDECRAYVYNPGVPGALEIGYSLPANAPAAGTAENAVPSQLAVAVSFIAAGVRPKPKYGRIFLPPQNPGVGADGRMSAAFANVVAQRVKTNLVAALETSLNTRTSASPAWRHAIISETGTPKHSDVATYGVGRVIDTIRSRRSSIPEDYTLVAK